MKDNRFEFTYKAPTEEERKEIVSIRKQYLTEEKEVSKLDRLRKLNSKVNDTATAISLVVGILGCLVFGLGLTCVLEWGETVLGIILGVIGAVPMALSYYVYRYVLKKNKEKHGAEILRLSEEILNENQDNQ